MSYTVVDSLGHTTEFASAADAANAFCAALTGAVSDEPIILLRPRVKIPGGMLSLWQTNKPLLEGLRRDGHDDIAEKLVIHYLVMATSVSKK